MSEHALVCTDLVDSTRTHERLGDERAAALWAEHDRATRSLLARHGGREVDRTDGFFLLFDAVADAAAFALGYHPEVAALGLSARLSVHVGPVTQRRNAPEDVRRGAKPVEVEGLAKPYAARLMALAGGGQTLLSATAQQSLAALPAGAVLECHGHYRLKGIEAPVQVFELGVPGQSPLSPPADSDKAWRVVADDGLWRPLREIPNNLGGERDAFVGRGAELRALAQQLDGGVRLLSVLGPGGTGKTRLARRYGRAWLGDWPGGVYFCDLSEARSLDGILFAVAATLGVPLGAKEAVAQIGHAIAARGRCLLILDNFEQVAAHAPDTLGHWLDRSADAAFLVTSRERLHLPGEVLLTLEPLALADEAIELFELRARAQRSDFALGADNRAAVAEAVRLLDGLPLAIELAAARIRVLSPAQLVERLRDRFAVLAGARGAAARQATLRAVIDWSWQLLSPWEQAALAQCAVFDGGFTLAAAEAVIDLGPWPEAPPAIDVVQALVDKSLLRSWVHASASRLDIDEPYFGMYLSIHEYAAQQLRREGGDPALAAETRHGRHFASEGTEAAIEALHTHGGVQRRAALALELDNLVVACRRAVARGDGAVAAPTCRAVWAVLQLQGPFALGAELGAQVLALDSLSTASRIEVSRTLAQALRRVGRRDEARACLEQALELARASGDRHAEGTMLESLSVLLTFEGRPKEGIALTQTALAMLREAGAAQRNEAIALGSLAVQLHDTGSLDEALPKYEAALAIYRSVGDRFAEGVVLGNLGTLHNDQGRLEQARALYLDSIAVCREIGDREGEGVALGNLGKLELDENHLDAAAAAYEASLRAVRDIGSRRTEGVSIGQLGIVLQKQGRLDEARAHYLQSLAIAREIGNRRFEGQTLANLAELLRLQGRLVEARALLAEAEALLREIDDPMDLGEVLCVRGRVDHALGDVPAARAALAEAEAAAAALGALPASGLGQAIAELRATLDGAA